LKRAGIIILLTFFLVPLPAVDKEGEEEIKPLDQERLETIQFGIDSEIIELIKNLKEEKNIDFNNELINLLEESANIQIKEQILAFFTETEYKKADHIALDILNTYDEDHASLVTAAIKYAALTESKDVLDAVAGLMESDDTSVASAAIRTIGRSGMHEYQYLLQQYYEDDDYPEEIKADIILALGDLKTVEAVPFLIELLENEDEEQVIRRYACDSLRKIGDPAAIEPLLQAYEDEDVLLRSYVMYALSGFEGEKIEKILIQGLRDSYIRVRISAARGLGDKKAKAAVPILIYKAKKDPEQKVRVEALKALGQIGSRESLDFIQDILKSEKSNPTQRVTALYIAVDKDLDNSIKLLEELIEKEWEKKDSRFLDYIAKQLSLQENGRLKKIFSHFLDHPSFTMKLYGLRGIKRNNFTDLKEKVRPLSEEGNHSLVRKTALSVLEDSK